MVAFTPNRNYPYPQPTDPADVPLRMKEFAEAVDLDLRNLEDRAVARPMAQFLGTITNTVPGTSTSGTLTWQMTDFNTVPVFNTEPAVQPVVDASTQNLTVNYTGFWYISSSVQIQTTIGGAGIDLVGIDILHNGGLVPPNARTTTHDTVFLADTTHLLDVSVGLFLNAGDTIAVRGVVGRSAGSNPQRFERRSITLLRMTQL